MTPLLTEVHKRKRLSWCRALPQNYFETTAFEDESNFCLNYNKKQGWFKPGDKTDPSNKYEKDEKVMVAIVIGKFVKSSLKIWRITNKDSRLDERVNSEVF